MIKYVRRHARLLHLSRVHARRIGIIVQAVGSGMVVWVLVLVLALQEF
jgi:hypothetical protein